MTATRLSSLVFTVMIWISILWTGIAPADGVGTAAGFPVPEAANESGCGFEAQPWVDRIGGEPGGRWRVRLLGKTISLNVKTDRLAGMELGAAADDLWRVKLFGKLPTTADGGSDIWERVMPGWSLQAQPAGWCSLELATVKTGREQMAHHVAATVRRDGKDLFAIGGSTTTGRGVDDHRYTARIRRGAWEVAPMYARYSGQDGPDPADANSHLFGIWPAQDATVTVYGADAHWTGTGRVSAGVRARAYDVDEAHLDAGYYSGRLAFDIATTTRVEVEAGRIHGPVSALRYGVLGVSARTERIAGWPLSFLQADARWIVYRDAAQDRNRALHVAWSGGCSLPGGWGEIKLAGTYKTDPYRKEDIGMLLSVTIPAGIAD